MVVDAELKTFRANLENFFIENLRLPVNLGSVFVSI